LIGLEHRVQTEKDRSNGGGGGGGVGGEEVDARCRGGKNKYFSLTPWCRSAGSPKVYGGLGGKGDRKKRDPFKTRGDLWSTQRGKKDVGWDSFKGGETFLTRTRGARGWREKRRATTRVERMWKISQIYLGEYVGADLAGGKNRKKRTGGMEFYVRGRTGQIKGLSFFAESGQEKQH